MHHLVIWFVGLIVGFIAVLSARLVFVLSALHGTSRAPSHRRNDQPASLAIFLGSGGHTAEMMRLIDRLDFNRYSTRTYIISSGDHLSEKKALNLEQRISSGDFRILRIPRARRVHQPYLTSPFTTIYSLSYCLWFITLAPLCSSRPASKQQRGSRQRTFADLILLNGPGSCVPIALAAFLPRLFALPAPSLIYVESLARTRRLSISARLVRPFVDRFFVQWRSLRDALVQKEEIQGAGDQARRDRWRLRARVEYDGWLV